MVKKNDATGSLSPPFQFILVSLSSGGLGYPRLGVPAEEPPPGTQHWVLRLMGIPGEGKVPWGTLQEHFAQS